MRGAESAQLALQPVEDFHSITGQGVEGVVAGRKVAVGSARAMEASAASRALAGAADALRTQGKGAMFAAIDGRVAALIAVADPIKETTPEAVRRCKEQGIRLVMLSGDARKTAEAVARQLGIDEVVAEVLPEQKVGEDQGAASARALRRDGGRRHQRRAGARAGERRHRDGHRHRRRDRERRRDARQGRPARASSRRSACRAPPCAT